METSALYRVQREDLPRLQKMLTECFAEDPLYHTLIPDPETRKRLMPELFECDLNEFYETCEIYAESPELKGLNSRWTAQLHQENRLHIIYLAVSPGARHTGVAEILMDEVIRYSESHRMLISLETHNEKNLSFYSHFGFKTFGIVEKDMGLKQYCLVREPQQA